MLVSLLAPAAYGHHVYEIQCQTASVIVSSPTLLQSWDANILKKEPMQEIVMFLLDVKEEVKFRRGG